MGLIGKIIDQVIGDDVREIVTEIFKNYTRVSPQICPPGIDGAPVVGDQGFASFVDGTGKTVTVGVYPDAQSLPGELRIYGRDADGVLVSEIYFKNDGTVNIESSLAGTLEKTVLGETLKGILESLIDEINLITVGTPSGTSSTPVNAAALTAIKGQLSTILSAGVKNN